MHKNLYYRHLYNNGVVRHHCVQALLNYTEMTAAALEGCSVRREEKQPMRAQVGTAALKLTGKGHSWWRDDALLCSIVMTSQDTLHVHRTLAIKHNTFTQVKSQMHCTIILQ